MLAQEIAGVQRFQTGQDNQRRSYRKGLDLDGDIETESLELGPLGEQKMGQEHQQVQEQQTYSGPSEKCINQVTLLGRVGTDPTIRGSEERPVSAPAPGAPVHAVTSSIAPDAR